MQGLKDKEDSRGVRVEGQCDRGAEAEVQSVLVVARRLQVEGTEDGCAVVGPWKRRPWGILGAAECQAKKLALHRLSTGL